MDIFLVQFRRYGICFVGGISVFFLAATCSRCRNLGNRLGSSVRLSSTGLDCVRSSLAHILCRFRGHIRLPVHTSICRHASGRFSRDACVLGMGARTGNSRRLRDSFSPHAFRQFLVCLPLASCLAEICNAWLTICPNRPVRRALASRTARGGGGSAQALGHVEISIEYETLRSPSLRNGAP